MTTPHATPETIAHIKEPYNLAELNARIASNDYNAELLLQHAMLLLNAQPAAAEVSDEFLYELWDQQYRSWIGGEQFEYIARAILALRQHTAPMTKGQVKQAVRFFSASTPRDVDDWIESIIRYAEEFHRITAQGV